MTIISTKQLLSAYLDIAIRELNYSASAYGARDYQHGVTRSHALEIDGKKYNVQLTVRDEE